MERDDKNTGFNRVCRLLYLVFPLSILLIGLYFYNFGSYSQFNIDKTINDIKFFTYNVQNKYLNKYKNFNTESLTYDTVLPFDIVIKSTPLGKQIINRFGGKLFVYESFYNNKERTAFYNMYHNQEEYKNTYAGVSAYIIYLTNLNKKECQSLSRYNWRKITPNFMGIEAAAPTVKEPYNGFFNLQYHILLDNLNEKVETKDKGIFSRKPLDKHQTKEACKCNFVPNCTIALKFH